MEMESRQEKNKKRIRNVSDLNVERGLLIMSYIKVAEAADRIGVSLVTAKRMISDGRLVEEKIGILVRAMDSKVSNS